MFVYEHVSDLIYSSLRLEGIQVQQEVTGQMVGELCDGALLSSDGRRLTTNSHTMALKITIRWGGT